MTADPAFDDLLRTLLDSANAARENGDVLQGQTFADERGWLSASERADMLRRMRESERLDQAINDCMDRLRADHARAWVAFLDRGIESFEAVERGEQSLDGVLPTQAERQLARLMVTAWKDLRGGRMSLHAVGYTLQMGHELAVRWVVGV